MRARYDAASKKKLSRDIFRTITSSQPPALGTCTIWRVATVKPTTWKLFSRCQAKLLVCANDIAGRCHKMWQVRYRSPQGVGREENQLTETRRGRWRNQKKKESGQFLHSPPVLIQLQLSCYCLSLSRIKCWTWILFMLCAVQRLEVENCSQLWS